jgi:hypothetical protein
MVEMDVEQFSLPIKTYATAYILIVRLAARRMVANKSGVIMTATTQHSRIGIPLSGGYGSATAAEEAFQILLLCISAPEHRFPRQNSYAL